jgi:hypothetical protein
MLRTGLLTIAMIVALQGFCFGQGFLDSLLGPGGLGLWGSDSSGQQYNNPQMWGGAQGPPQQPYQQPGAPGQQQMTYPQGYPQGYPQQGYGYPQAPGYGQPQQGVYADWQNYTPAPIGGDQQQYAPQQESSPPQQYPAQQQYQAPTRYTAPPVQAAPARPAQRTQGQPSLRPGQYVPGQAPLVADDLPPGSVRMTTTTPQGTRVEYYPPADEPGMTQGAAQPPVRRLKPKPAAAKAQSAVRPREQTAGRTESSGGSSVAMPKPVEIPQGQDPRYGWGAAVNRGPIAPDAR